LKELASRSPIPGGGSAAALVGAVGVSLLAKVANFTVGKEKYKSVEKEMQDILNQCSALSCDCERLCSEDAEAYKKLSEVFKMPKGDERSKSLEKALKEAIDVPLEICKRAYQTIKLCLPVVEKGNVNLITDTAIASLLLKAAFESGLLNVEINLKSIKDKEFVTTTRKILRPMEEEISIIDKKVQAVTKKNLK